MKLSMQFQQNLENKQFLTSQLKQSLDILKYSMEELEEYIREEASANPLIELDEQQNTQSIIEMARIQDKAVSSYSTEESFDAVLQASSEDISIEHYVLQQLALHKGLTDLEKKVVKYYIRSLNDIGYLECDIEEVALHFHLSVSKCEQLLQLLQSCEPIGIGARDLKECLLLQISRKEDAPELAVTLINKHLADLADQKFNLLAQQYNISLEEIQKAFQYIQCLNPYPILEVDTVRTEYVIPEISVEVFNEEFVIHINDFHLPKITINSYYEELLRENPNEETTEFLKTKLSDAFLLMKGIEQRHETLYKVTKVILQKQENFLKLGKKVLKPLRLKDVSEILEIHESTVSRAIRNKYIQTPIGTFLMKDLFVRGVKTVGGAVESTAYIKEKIKKIIEQEDIKKPLSDQKIANMLLAEGIHIARRTIAKYRENLGILHSTERRGSPKNH